MVQHQYRKQRERMIVYDLAELEKETEDRKTETKNAACLQLRPCFCLNGNTRRTYLIYHLLI